MKSVKTSSIVFFILILSFVVGWAWPKSHTLSVSPYHFGYYRGFGLPGVANPIFGNRYYLITVNVPDEGYLKVKYRRPGYNRFKRFYPDGRLAEEGECMVEPYGSAEPVPDQHDLLWSKCYEPDGTMCSEVKNGIGTQIYWTPQAVRRWELELADFKRVCHSMWYSNGQLQVTQCYVDGNADGSFVSYYPSGAKEIEGAYSKGDRVGKWIRYNEDGSISKIDNYISSALQNNQGSED